MLLSNSDEITTQIIVGDHVLFDQNTCRIMAGPCSVENRDQVMYTAERLAKLGIKIFRAGSFKPRTNPYAFQGSGEEGLKWLAEVRDTYHMKIITETTDLTNFEAVEAATDIIQIGAKAMYDHSLLRAAGKSKKPFLLKRHFAATVEELFKMADFALLEGNRQIMFCERGIRTFEPSTRFTLDLCGASVIKRDSRAPLILDPSHSIGYSFGVPDISRACVAFGCEGILIEVHNDPDKALCDKEQALSIEEFDKLYQNLKAIGEAIGRSVE